MIVLVGLAGFGAFVGVVLVLRGWRGRLVITPARCASCDYVLAEAGGEGTDDARKACPECGASLGAHGAIRIARHRARPRLIGVGLVTLAGAGLVLTPSVASRVAGRPFADLLPTGVVLAVLDLAPEHFDSGWAALWRRHEAAALSPESFERATAIVRAHLPERGVTGLPEEALRLWRGRATASTAGARSQLIRPTRSDGGDRDGDGPHWTLRAPKAVRADGEARGFEVTVVEDGRWAGSVDIVGARFESEGRAWDVRVEGPQRTTMEDGPAFVMSARGPVSADVPFSVVFEDVDLGSGVLVIEIATTTFTIIEGTGGARDMASWPVAGRQVETFRCPIEVISGDELVVAFEAIEDLQPDVRRSLRPSRSRPLRVIETPEGFVIDRRSVARPYTWPEGAAFPHVGVEVWIDGRWRRLGAMSLETGFAFASNPPQFKAHVTDWTDIPLPEPCPERVDLRYVPLGDDPAIELAQVWGATEVFTGVPLVHPDRPTVWPREIAAAPRAGGRP